MINIHISETDKKESVRAYAYRTIKENILNLTLTPGEALSEKEIAQSLSISRTPVREAFIRLSQEGLLEIMPQRGSYVSKIDTEQIAEFRFLRLTMEQAVMKLACVSFSDEYKQQLEECLIEQSHVEGKNYSRFFTLDNLMHSIIFSGCGKPHIWNIIREANLNYQRARVLDLSSKQSEIDLLFRQHKKIFKAIVDSDVAAGVAIITVHINKVISDVRELRNEYLEFFK